MKILFGVGELYNCAAMVMVVEITNSDNVLLKYAAIEVTVPSPGTENALLLIL